MRVEDTRKTCLSLFLSPLLLFAHLDIDALDHHLPRLEQHLGHHADLALVRAGDDLHGVARLDVHGLEGGLAVGRQRRRLPLLAGALLSGGELVVARFLYVYSSGFGGGVS